MKFPIKFILLLALFAFGNASAITLDPITLNFVCITDNNASNCELGEAKFSVEASANGDGTDFKFSNAVIPRSQNPGISEIYFDSSLLVGIDSSDNTATSEVLLIEGSLVDFTLDSLSQGNLPGGKPIGFSTAFGTEAVSSQANTIQEGQLMTISILTLLFSDFTNALADDFRIGLHVRGYDNGGSESFVTPMSPVPVPAAFWLFGTALIGFIGISRRTKV